MKKSTLVIIPVVVVGVFAAFALSPYFTESTINENLPEGAVVSPPKEPNNTITLDTDTKFQDVTLEEAIKESPISYSGNFVGVGDGIHDAQGDVFTIPLENGNTVLRLENFKSTNGPDLFVYLSIDDQASDFVNLGELKANRGNQNYEIPQGVDLAQYNKVLIWCKLFGVLFGSAELST